MCIAFSIGKSCRGLLPSPVVGQTRAERRNILRVCVSHWMIDAILAVNVLPSLYFQMFHHAMYMILIMIIICVFLLYAHVTVSDFLFFLAHRTSLSCRSSEYSSSSSSATVQGASAFHCRIIAHYNNNNLRVSVRE